MRRIWTALIVALAVAALAGCPKSRKHTRTLPDLPTNGDPQARSRFQQARTSFERDAANNAEEFEAIAREYPNDPIAPFATFYAGRAAFRGGSYEDARGVLDPLLARDDLDAALRARIRLYAGMTYGYLGDHARAIATLDDPDAASDDDERAERSAVLAEAHVATGRASASFAHYDAWFPLATKAERAFILARVGEVAAGLDAAAAQSAYDALSEKGGPSALALSQRAAALATAAGDRDLAAVMRAAAERARIALDLDAALDHGPGNTDLVGAVLPLSGKRSRVGSAAMAGLGLAAGTFDAKPARGVGIDGAPKPFVLSTRDSKSLADSAADAVTALVAEGAVAVVGPLDAASVRVAARQAARDGIPLVALDALGGADIGVESPFVFHVTLSPEARARALARHAIDKGVKRFAILRPASNYGSETADAFEDEVTKLGGRVITSTTYPTKTTSFGKIVNRIRGKPWDAVFVPDLASRLELVVPALASANLVVMPLDAKGEPKTGRKIGLLSTAEALRPKYLRGSGRYSEGAVFAPGFYADADDPIIGPYVTRFEAAFGRAPTYLDAYAYDGALAIRAAVESGARSRAEVSAAMAASAVKGLTGAIQFSSAHHRADSGLLYVVDKDSGGDYRIRAQR